MAKYKKGTKLAEWQKKAKLGGTCAKCGKTGELTVDHRIPQSLLQQLGFVDEVWEWDENFVLLCKACNAFKMNRIDILDPRAVKNLKEIVSKL